MPSPRVGIALARGAASTAGTVRDCGGDPVGGHRGRAGPEHVDGGDALLGTTIVAAAILALVVLAYLIAQMARSPSICSPARAFAASFSLLTGRGTLPGRRDGGGRS